MIGITRERLGFGVVSIVIAVFVFVLVIVIVVIVIVVVVVVVDTISVDAVVVGLRFLRDKVTFCLVELELWS